MTVPEPSYNLEFDICRCQQLVQRVRDDPVFAQNLYAALCNTVWQYKDAWYILKGRHWSCSWRHAGSIVADILGTGRYTDFYCSGMQIYHEDDKPGINPMELKFVPEGLVVKEVEEELARLGWQCIYDTSEI